MLMVSSPIVTPVVCMLVSWFLHWVENSNTFWSTILATISSPIISALSTLTMGPAVTPVAILYRDLVFSNGLLSFKNLMYSRVSLRSHSFLLLPASFCWSLVVYETYVKFCITSLTSEHAGFDNIHIKHWISSIPLPRVRPLEVFRLCMSVCSMSISDDIPHNRKQLLNEHES